MNNTKTLELQHEILGDLQPLYDEYVEVIDSVAPDAADVKVPYVQEVVADRVSAALKKLTPESSYEQFTAAIEKAGHSKMSAKENALRESGFVGSIAKLFKSVVAIDAIAEDADRLEQLKKEADVYLKVPKERQKAAKVITNGAYYWGGHYIPLEVENKKGDI